MRWNPRRALRWLPERAGDGPAGALARLLRGEVENPAVAAIETLGFWAAVVLPLCYVPLLLTGLSSGRDAALLGALVVLHLIALSAGHAHNRD